MRKVQIPWTTRAHRQQCRRPPDRKVLVNHTHIHKLQGHVTLPVLCKLEVSYSCNTQEVAWRSSADKRAEQNNLCPKCWDALRCKDHMSSRFFCFLCMGLCSCCIAVGWSISAGKQGNIACKLGMPHMLHTCLEMPRMEHSCLVAAQALLRVMH